MVQKCGKSEAVHRSLVPFNEKLALANGRRCHKSQEIPRNHRKSQDKINVVEEWCKIVQLRGGNRSLVRIRMFLSMKSWSWPTDGDVINQKSPQSGAMLWRERCYKSGKRHNANSIDSKIQRRGLTRCKHCHSVAVRTRKPRATEGSR